MLAEELAEIRAELGDDAFDAGMFGRPARCSSEVALADDFVDFLTAAGLRG